MKEFDEDENRYQALDMKRELQENGANQDVHREKIVDQKLIGIPRFYLFLRDQLGWETDLTQPLFGFVSLTIEI